MSANKVMQAAQIAHEAVAKVVVLAAIILKLINNRFCFLFNTELVVILYNPNLMALPSPFAQ